MDSLVANLFFKTDYFDIQIANIDHTEFIQD